MYTIFKIPVVIILAPVLAFTGPHSKAEPGGCRYLEVIIVGLVPGGPTNSSVGGSRKWVLRGNHFPVPEIFLYIRIDFFVVTNMPLSELEPLLQTSLHFIQAVEWDIRGGGVKKDSKLSNEVHRIIWLQGCRGLPILWMKCYGECKHQRAGDGPKNRGQYQKEEGRETAGTLSLELGETRAWIQSGPSCNPVADQPSYQLENAGSFPDLEPGSEVKSSKGVMWESFSSGMSGKWHKSKPSCRAQQLCKLSI